MSDDPFDQLEEMLSSLFGPQMAGDAVDALRASGVDPSMLAQMGGMNLSQLDPSQLMAMRAQMQHLFASSGDSSVNWRMGEEVALQGARSGGDPLVTADVAERSRQALTVADLWLDTATDLLPAPGTREAWSRADWAERTLPVWKDICEPVAEAATGALADAMADQAQDLPEEMAGMAQQVGALGQVMRSMAGTAFGLQLGHAVGQLATEALSATDVGLPLTREPGTAMVPTNVIAFAEGLEVPEEEARLFLATREAATARLYAHVPWLRGHVMGAVEAYAREIRIDTTAVEQAVSQVDPSDPEALRQALGEGMFAPEETDAQRAALERLETLLAVMEGWVQVVTAQAVAPHLPHAVALAEMVRRRRAQGGAAEQLFAQLIGLTFRPRRAREAARLWTRLGEQVGTAERDAFWNHPDLMPTAAELVSPDNFLTLRRAAAEMESEMDADLASLLDGTLGYSDAAAERSQEGSGGKGQEAGPDGRPSADGEDGSKPA